MRDISAHGRGPGLLTEQKGNKLAPNCLGGEPRPDPFRDLNHKTYAESIYTYRNNDYGYDRGDIGRDCRAALPRAHGEDAPRGGHERHAGIEGRD